MPEITRREFVKGAAAGAAAGAAMVAGAGILASCDSDTDAEQEPQIKWDDEADVVVVGLGGAGGSAALAAHAGGADVLVIEKLPTAGGTTAISGGWIWIPNNPLMKDVGVDDSREDALKYVAHFGMHQRLASRDRDNGRRALLD